MSPTAPLPALPAPWLGALLDQLAARRGDALALSWRDTQASPVWSALTYAALAQRADAMAACLHHQHGVRPGDRVAWLGLNHPAQIALLFALARLGALLVPLNHRLSPAEWQDVLQDCQPTLLVHDANLGAAARDLSQRLHPGPALLPVEAFDTFEQAATSTQPEAGGLDSPALLVYTSGTTGRPKGAVHTQRNLLANMAIAAQVQALGASDTVLTVLPLFHVGGLCIQTLPALSVGAHVLLMSRFDAAATLACIGDDRPTLTLQVPATLQALTAHAGWPGADLSSLRAVWAGSSVLPSAPLKAFMDRGVPVCNVYGSTETGPFSIALPPPHAASHIGSCGWAAPGVEVQLLDTNGQAVATGQVGEVCVRADNVVHHYWPDHPARDAEGFFHTGDLAQQASDGSHTVVGRAKDMIISGGENIYPAEIENLLVQHPAVADCAVIGQPDPRWGEVAVAVVVLREPPHMDGWEAPLLTWLDGRLARYKWPRRWVRVDSLPRTALGKVQKAALKTWLEGEGFDRLSPSGVIGDTSR
ncbi:MAG: AMP-binding protein [Hydrogenophaga sp.]|nr:AMP-binding protein [Hydrogenophaga sp.]